MGKQVNKPAEKLYVVSLKDSWEIVSDATRMTKSLIEGSQLLSMLPQITSLTQMSPEEEALEMQIMMYEDKLLGEYLTPHRDESFRDYRDRFFGTLDETKNWKTWLTRNVVNRKKVPLGLNLGVIVDDMPNVLTLKSTVRENKYDLFVFGNGMFKSRAKIVGEGLTEYLGLTGIKHSYDCIDV